MVNEALVDIPIVPTPTVLKVSVEPVDINSLLKSWS